jgi:hypothetical protein
MDSFGVVNGRGGVKAVALGFVIGNIVGVATLFLPELKIKGRHPIRNTSNKTATSFLGIFILSIAIYKHYC